MKTKLIGITTAIVTLIASALSAPAQSKSLPIDSMASAVSYDELHIRQVYGSLNASSLVNTNGVRTFWSLNYNPNGVAQVKDFVSMVVTNPFAFMLTRPTNDWVNASVSYNSADGDQLFYQGVGFYLVISNGTWVVPDSARTNLQTYLGYYEPIYETNAISAHLNLRDSNGNLWQTLYLNVYFNSSTRVGRIMNYTQYLGQHGEIVVSYAQYDQYGNVTNSYDVAFALDEDKGGVALPTTKATASFIPNWGNLIVPLSPPNVVLTNVQSFNHVGTSPLVEVTITNATVVFVGASTVEGEVANGFTIKSLQQGVDNAPQTFTYPGNGLQLILQPGVYHIDFIWPQLAPAQIYPDWYYGGGKGTPVTEI